LLISAHNEETCIADRVQNALASDYPSDKLTICIASDGSVDRTNEIVGAFPDTQVRLLAYDVRRGKAATLNSSIRQIKSDIVVFSDANTLFEPDAISRLVRWFADPSVGVVCGKLILTDSKTGRNVDGRYWRYETFLKQCEGKLGGLLGANGAIYAMRRELYCPIPDNTITDDFVIPLFAKLKHRFRIVYDATAIAHEETAPTIGHEFRRRVRIGSGDYQSLLLLWPLLNPRHGWTSFTFVGHKLLRWLSPFFLLTAIVSNIFLLPSPFYVATLLIQLAFYTTALVGIWAVGDSRATKLLRGATLFCSVNAALLVGFFRWATTVQTGMWQRTDR
jgi:cellulose synthase/poly-beta-1,6-N-acetylglucosamine synthase-like glycosyltransferase